MSRLPLAVVALVAVSLGAPAHAGDVCVNEICRNVPGAEGRATISLTGTVKATGGVTGGPGVRPTGLESAVVKLDNVALYPVVDGAQLGRVGVTNGSGIVWLYLGPEGCRQTSEDETLVPCHPPGEPG